MSVQEQIHNYIAAQSELKQNDLRILHELILQINPDALLWFLDGTNDQGKVVSNPNIGYGSYEIQYANGKTRTFYQVGLSANTAGISVYIMGIDDKNYLTNNFADQIGKASVSGYCIKFKSLKDIDLSVLKKAINIGFEAQNQK
ncbi:DUF1801 domain-containing protein [Flavobacterium sp. CYK-55]|uniref:DUF1801 domain-containing protein n=1 Tax=Flavobacterium sp. CYK-55 TaxID=2835529 RepID=UPI001BCE16F5|nr:DUF1801 domain-containing protein [Flavobacterium sp. CYK-55]MBS7786325.1 DUF1801 domain-containing protein [Flavobacterium sp. CYK-55]